MIDGSYMHLYYELFPKFSIDAVNLYRKYSRSEDPVVAQAARIVIYMTSIVSRLKVDLDLTLLQALPSDLQQEIRKMADCKTFIDWMEIYEINQNKVPENYFCYVECLENWLKFNLLRIYQFTPQATKLGMSNVLPFLNELTKLFERFGVNYLNVGVTLPNIDFVTHYRRKGDQITWCDNEPDLAKIIERFRQNRLPAPILSFVESPVRSAFSSPSTKTRPLSAHTHKCNPDILKKNTGERQIPQRSVIQPFSLFKPINTVPEHPSDPSVVNEDWQNWSFFSVQPASAKSLFPREPMKHPSVTRILLANNAPLKV